MVKNVKIELKDGCVTIRDRRNNILSFSGRWFNLPGRKHLNIYIVVEDINAIEIGGMKHNAVLFDLSGERINYETSNQNV